MEKLRNKSVPEISSGTTSSQPHRGATSYILSIGQRRAHASIVLVVGGPIAGVCRSRPPFSVHSRDETMQE